MLKLSSLRSKKSPREASGWTWGPAWTTATTATTGGPPPRAATLWHLGPGPGLAHPAVTAPTCLSTLRTTAAAAQVWGGHPAWGRAPGHSDPVPWDSGPGSLARPPLPEDGRGRTAPAHRTELHSQQGKTKLTLQCGHQSGDGLVSHVTLTLLVQDEI